MKINKKMRKENKPTALRMSDAKKKETFQAVLVAIGIVNQRHEALNKYRNEVLTFAANNPGNYSFSFNMDFMKVSRKLMVGYVGNCYAQSQIKKCQISDESLKTARETGASYQEVRELFLLLMKQYIIS